MSRAGAGRPLISGRQTGFERRLPAAFLAAFLSQPYAGAELQGGVLRALTSDAANVQQTCGALLAQQPARPRSFVLPFESNTHRLGAAAEPVLADLRAALANLPAAEVIVTGHTDRVGSVEANDRLSLARAAAVRELLVGAGGGPGADQRGRPG